MIPTDEQLFAITEGMACDSAFQAAARAAYERVATAKGFSSALTATASELSRINIFVLNDSPEVLQPLRSFNVGILCKVEVCPPKTPFIPDPDT